MPSRALDPSVDIPDVNSLPNIERAPGDRTIWIVGGTLTVVAILLFAALEARRDAVVDSPTLAADDSGALISAPPALAMPVFTAEDFEGVATPAARPAPVMLRAISQAAPVGPTRATPIIPALRGPAFYDPGSPDPPYTPRNTALFVPTPPPGIDADGRPNIRADLAGNRVGATRFANPGATVPQGAVIQAVLETALDSNRPGFVRAIVSRDVRSFDGTKVLVPRGSRLFGEYKAELAKGQNRAFIQWLTLTRPDGVQIAVNSPAADQLGRSGVKGDVNSHFFERFAGALLQSTLDLGVGLLTRSASSDTVVLGLPGSNSVINTGNEQPQPTLKVKHGASVSVFVARDLDFTAVL